MYEHGLGPTGMSYKDKATLTLTEVDGVYVLKATEGTVLPAALAVVDETGRQIGSYAVPAPDVRGATTRDSFTGFVSIDDMPIVLTL
ncbi:hypothetical protein [Streptomyces sp. NPDC051567]|uniref:hypothetical protein n=1 Tax=Streptomyces sp. NPDC051567 TaxID=3365660 RepID=UPI00378ADE7B